MTVSQRCVLHLRKLAQGQVVARCSAFPTRTDRYVRFRGPLELWGRGADMHHRHRKYAVLDRLVTGTLEDDRRASFQTSGLFTHWYLSFYWTVDAHHRSHTGTGTWFSLKTPSHPTDLTDWRWEAVNRFPSVLLDRPTGRSPQSWWQVFRGLWPDFDLKVHQDINFSPVNSTSYRSRPSHRRSQQYKGRNSKDSKSGADLTLGV